MNILQSEPGQDPVTISGIFNVSPARLFRAWTEATELKKWFGPKPNSLLSVDVNLLVGGVWRFLVSESAEKKIYLTGEYLQIEPDKALVFSWSHVEEFSNGRREATAYSRVTVRFTGLDQGTRLDLCHEKILSEDGRLGVGRGWSACVTNLVDHCEVLAEEA